MIGAILLGLVAGYLGRVVTPGRRGPKGCLPTIALGVVGAVVGYLIFTEGLGIGDTEVFDFGGLPGAVIGVVLVLLFYRWVARAAARAG
jgi:uncharacterized membrane protein YeaQ/YmgE (transglycosylase-associated protein family)